MTNKPSDTLDIKSELKWLAVFAVGSAVAVGIMTDFQFRPIEIQLHDSYYVFDAFRAIEYAALGCFMIRGFCHMVDLLTTRYRILALFVSIINPLLALIIIIVATAGFQAFVSFREDYPETSILRILVPMIIVGTAVVLQVVVEIRMIRKLKDILNAS